MGTALTGGVIFWRFGLGFKRPPAGPAAGAAAPKPGAIGAAAAPKRPPAGPAAGAAAPKRPPPAAGAPNPPAAAAPNGAAAAYKGGVGGGWWCRPTVCRCHCRCLGTREAVE